MADLPSSCVAGKSFAMSRRIDCCGHCCSKCCFTARCCPHVTRDGQDSRSAAHLKTKFRHPSHAQTNPDSLALRHRKLRGPLTLVQEREVSLSISNRKVGTAYINLKMRNESSWVMTTVRRYNTVVPYFTQPFITDCARSTTARPLSSKS